MDDPRWLRLIMIGLVLAALAVGYFLLTGKLSTSKITKESPPPSVLGQDTQAIPTLSPSASPASAYTRIVNRTQGGVQVLPNTGFPAGLLVVFSISAIISGWGLRKFPH